MADPLTCSVRTVSASDGTSIPVPSGGLGLPDGSAVTIDPNAQVQINVNTDASGNVVGWRRGGARSARWWPWVTRCW
jgi:hypothetical protein